MNRTQTAIIFVSVTLLAILGVVYVSFPPIAQQSDIIPYVTVDELIKNRLQYLNKTVKINATLYHQDFSPRLLGGYQIKHYIRDETSFIIKLVYLPDENNRIYDYERTYTIEGKLIEVESINPQINEGRIETVFQPSLMTKH